MFELFNQYMESVKDSIRYYKTINELNRLTDRELQDLGLSRCDIFAVANQTFINKYTR